MCNPYLIVPLTPKPDDILDDDAKGPDHNDCTGWAGQRITIIQAFGENTRTNVVSLSRTNVIISGNFSDLHTAAPRIVTRPWPNWFLFSFTIPPAARYFSPAASWNKTSNSRRRKSRKTPHSAGKHKKSAEGSAKRAPLWGYRKVKIINVDSIEALHAHKGGKTLHLGSADPRGVINSFKGAGIKSEQHGSGQGERMLSVLQTGLAPARAFSPALPAPLWKNKKQKKRHTQNIPKHALQSSQCSWGFVVMQS